MKLAIIIRRLGALKNKNDVDGALDLLTEQGSGFPALHAIVMSDWVELMQRADMVELIETADAPAPGNSSVLHMAAVASPEMLKATLLARINHGMFGFDDDDHTPVMKAVQADRIENVRLLVQAGADLDQVGESLGYTALEMACWSGNKEMLRYLIDAGADPTLVNMDMSDAFNLDAEGLNMLDDAIAIRSSMNARRFKTIEVDMDSGEAQFVMPAAIDEMGDLFISDVIGDMANGAKQAQLEHGEKALGDGPGAQTAAQILGMAEVGAGIGRKQAIKSAQDAKPTPGRKPH